MQSSVAARFIWLVWNLRQFAVTEEHKKLFLLAENIQNRNDGYDDDDDDDDDDESSEANKP